MHTKELSKPEWERYFNLATKNMLGQQVDIEIASNDLGNSFQEQNVPITGLSYDPHNDIFFVHTPSLQHQIQHPKSVFVVEEGLELRSVEILDQNDNKQLVRMKPQKCIV